MARYWFSAVVILMLGLLIGTIGIAQSGAQQGQPALTQLGAPVKGVYRAFNQPLQALELDSNGKTVYVKVDPKAKTSITGSAEPSFLAPQMMIKFDCLANANGQVKDPVAKLSVVEPSDVESPAFSIDDPKAITLLNKKLTKEEMEEFKKYFVRGTITKATEEEVSIKVPNTTVKAKIAPNAKIDVQSKQYQYVQPGDDVVVSQGKEAQQQQPAQKGGATKTPTTPAPAQPAVPKAPATPAVPKIPPKGPTTSNTVDPTARFILAEWLEVTAKSPLVGKKKPGTK